jgi:hypothetical protein
LLLLIILLGSATLLGRTKGEKRLSWCHDQGISKGIAKLLLASVMSTAPLCLMNHVKQNRRRQNAV